MFQVLMFSLVSVVIGLLFTFAGYRFFRFLLPLYAFFAGMSFGLSSMDALLNNGFLATSMGIIIGFIVGLILAAISYFAYSFAIVIFGSTVGYSLGSGLMLLIGFNPGFMTWLVGIIVAVVFAVAFVALRMPTIFVVVASAFGGSIAVIMGLFVLFGQIPAEIASTSLTRVVIGDSFVWMLIWIVLSGMGIVAQMATEKEVNSMKPYELK